MKPKYQQKQEKSAHRTRVLRENSSGNDGNGPVKERYAKQTAAPGERAKTLDYDASTRGHTTHDASRNMSTKGKTTGHTASKTL